jgi:glucoamylase
MSETSLTEWMARQSAFSVTAMLRAVSATGLVMERPHFGQRVTPKRGSVLAAPEIASYDPNPDYFFHWLRDSSIVIDALRVAIGVGAPASEAGGHFGDYVHFSLGLCRLDGETLFARGDPFAAIDPAFRKNVRSESELRAVIGDGALGDVRYNADGSLDILGWSRPQNDGPALRALTVLRWLQLGAPPQVEAQAVELLVFDLDYCARHWAEPCFDLWEEIKAHHYYTRLVQFAALSDGAVWAAERGDAVRASAYRAAAAALLKALDAHFDSAEGYILAYLPDPAISASIPPARRLDMAVPLGVIHAARTSGRHSALDPRVFATLRKLEDFFAGEYPINRRRASNCAPAMGRYPGDVYFTGGAWHLSTLGAAQFYYRFAEAVGTGENIEIAPENRGSLATLLGEDQRALASSSLAPHYRKPLFGALFAHGDMFMEMTRAYTPDSGELAEQFSQIDGAPTSARNLAWSYAAFVTAHASREAAQRHAPL